MKPRLVLFDLDGTLADTAPDIARATNRVLAEAGRPPLSLAEVRATVSFGARALIRTGFDQEPDKTIIEQLVSRLFEIYSQSPSRKTRLFAGLAELIGELTANGLRWGVVTNKPESLAVPIVEALGIKSDPVCIIGGDSLPRKKPDPLPLLEGCRRAGAPPTEAVYVGDAEIDAKAASAANMPLVIAGFGYAPEREATRAWGNSTYAANVETLARVLGLRKVPAGAA
jgi:phosphoglycolate phosphatase